MRFRLFDSIDRKLVPLLLRVAQKQRRFPVEVVEEALLLYFRGSGVEVELGPGIGRELGEIHVEHLDQGQRERGVEPLSEEDAMRLAN